jgi:glutamate dehydrogenase/leucine dehydrogenase
LSYGGSLIRPEATGYGTVYFAQEMLQRGKMSFEGMRVAISGSGNVAQFAAQKAMAMDAQVITVSDSGGTAYAPHGFTAEMLHGLMEIKNVQYGRVEEFARRYDLQYEAGKKPWHIPAEIALPCATQNEIGEEDARTLVKNGVKCIAEGANMPSTAAAVQIFHDAGVLYGPGKASNAGGVATSGLEMSQNAVRLNWPREELDQRLHDIIKGIHEMCVAYGARLDGATLVRCRFSDPRPNTAVELTRASLKAAVLLDCDLGGANLYRADLAGTVFVRCNLEGATLTGADATGAHLIDCRTIGADLPDALRAQRAEARQDPSASPGSYDGRPR